MKKMICFDLDGTLADFYSVPHWLEKLQAEDPSPYLEAKPMWDMKKLRQVLLELIEAEWEIRVISWLAKDSSEEYKKAVRQAKKAWLWYHNFPISKAHLVAYGTTKAKCIGHLADVAILIDDNEKVRNGWHLGETIDPTNCDLIQELKKLLVRG